MMLLWSKVSKAADKSSKTNAVVLPLYMFVQMSLWIFSQAVSVVLLKNICDIYNYNLHSFLSIHISGSKIISQIWICPIIMFYYVCFVVHLNYSILKIMIERMWRDDYLLNRSVRYIISSNGYLVIRYVVLYIDWVNRTADVYVTLTPNSRQVRRYPHISGQNKNWYHNFIVHTWSCYCIPFCQVWS